MIVMIGRVTAVVVCVVMAASVTVGCAGKAPPDVEIRTAAKSVLDASESIALARAEGASAHAPQELSTAESLLDEARELLREDKGWHVTMRANQADIEAKISMARARAAKAERRAVEVREGRMEIAWEAKNNEVATAKARRTIAERMALSAQKEAEKASARANRHIQRAETELAVARAELELGIAEGTGASEYAEQDYATANSLLKTAKAALAADDFQSAAASAEEARRHASNAHVQARARLAAANAESSRLRDRAVAAMAKAQVSLERSEEALAVQYAEDLHEEARGTLREAELAMDAEEYEKAESLAEQARVSASKAQAVAVAKQKETQDEEAQEDTRANALDAIGRAERVMADARAAGAAELAEDAYKEAQSALGQAEKALQEGSFEKVLSLARDSISQSAVALAISEAKTDHERRTAETESKIAEEAEGIPEVVVRRTTMGVVISMGGTLFTPGGSQVSTEARDKLKAAAELLKRYPNYRIIVEGHTDDLGSEDTNLGISTERAHNFLRYMVDKEGISLERLSSVGYGESRPIASNADEAGRRQNRRVDIVILTKPVSP